MSNHTMDAASHRHSSATPESHDEKTFPGDTMKPSDLSDDPELEAAPTTAARIASYTAAPDGGARAWLVVAGSACIFFSCLGFQNSFGVFEQYYLAHQLRDQPPDNVAWIGSLTAFIQFAGGAVAGPMFDRYGAWVVRPAAVLYVAALMITSVCSQYWHFILAQGLLSGFAMSLLQVPAFAAVAQYFDKKRAAALGVVVSGSSIGGIVFPIALSKMLNGTDLGFGWSVRIMAFVVTPLLLFASLTVGPRLPSRKTNFFIGAAFKEPRFMMIVVAAFCCFIGMFTPLFYIPTFAVSKGVEPTMASYLLAIVNAASTFGRIIPGMVADKYGKLNVFGFGGIATGIVVLCLTATNSLAGLIVYSIAFGFTSGTIISGSSAALSMCTDNPRNLGTYIGMGMALASASSLVGPPVDGVMLKVYGSFLQACIFSGVICIFGGFLALATKTTTPKGLFGRA